MAVLGLHTAQGLETSILSAVSVVPTAIKYANEKGRLSTAGWPYPLLCPGRKGWMLLYGPVGIGFTCALLPCLFFLFGLLSHLIFNVEL